MTYPTRVVGTCADCRTTVMLENADGIGGVGLTWKCPVCLADLTVWERLGCNAMGVKHDAHTWDFGGGETFTCPGDPDGYLPTTTPTDPPRDLEESNG